MWWCFFFFKPEIVGPSVPILFIIFVEKDDGLCFSWLYSDVIMLGSICCQPHRPVAAHCLSSVVERLRGTLILWNMVCGVGCPPRDAKQLALYNFSSSWGCCSINSREESLCLWQEVLVFPVLQKAGLRTCRSESLWFRPKHELPGFFVSFHFPSCLWQGHRS